MRPFASQLACRLGTILFGLALLTSCQDSGQFQDLEERSGKKTWTIGGTEVTIEVAWNSATRQRGLMHRDTLPADRGMLFLYPEADIRYFWMKDTYIPLDIAFLTMDGTIVNIEQMQPLEETPGAVSIQPVVYALEMNQGWFARHGIKAGDQLEIPAWVHEVVAE